MIENWEGRALLRKMRTVWVLEQGESWQMQTAWVVRIHTVGWDMLIGKEIGFVSLSRHALVGRGSPVPSSWYTSKSNVPT